MSRNSLRCTNCGGHPVPKDGVYRCPHCGKQYDPPRSRGDALKTLQHAIDLRMARDFHRAEEYYDKVLLVTPEEAEALWGRLLCHYGVEYVEDPATKKKLPTVHTVRELAMQDHPDFLDACKYATSEALRKEYEQQAAYIDNVQAQIRHMSRSCPPYDVFICQKTTLPDTTNEETEDCKRARALCDFLRKEIPELRVFFAPEIMKYYAGANYEAHIYHALHTARAMLLVCSDTEYINSAWVRSEWMRYLSLMEQEREQGLASQRWLIPLLYGRFSNADLPPTLQQRQFIPMTDEYGVSTVLSNIRRLLPKEEAQPVRDVAAHNLENAFIEITDGRFDAAAAIVDPILNTDITNARANLARLLIDLKVRSTEALADVEAPFTDNYHFRRARDYGDEALKDTLTEAQKQQADRVRMKADAAFRQQIREVENLLEKEEWEAASARIDALRISHPDRYEVPLMQTLWEYGRTSMWSLQTCTPHFEQSESWQKALELAPEYHAVQLRHIEQEAEAFRAGAEARRTEAVKELECRGVDTYIGGIIPWYILTPVPALPTVCVTYAIFLLSPAPWAIDSRYGLAVSPLPIIYVFIIFILTLFLLLYQLKPLLKAHRNKKLHRFHLRLFYMSDPTEVLCHWDPEPGVEYTLHVDGKLALYPASPGHFVSLPDDDRSHIITLSRVRMYKDGKGGTLDALACLRVLKGLPKGFLSPRYNIRSAWICWICLCIVTLLLGLFTIPAVLQVKDSFPEPTFPVAASQSAGETTLTWPAFCVPGTDIPISNVDYLIERLSPGGEWEELAVVTETSCSVPDPLDTIGSPCYRVTVRRVGWFGSRTELHTVEIFGP